MIKIRPAAKQSLPTQGSYGEVVNFRPGDGLTVMENPPRFSWIYTANVANIETDVAQRMFRLQISESADMSSPVVDIWTRFNFYNFLAPLSAGVNYWRVGYSLDMTEAVDSWSAIRSFTVSEGAVEWDRSMLADEDYLATAAAHPHMLFNAGNKAAMFAWLEAHGGSQWTDMKAAALTTVGQAWWGTLDVTDAAKSVEIARVAFVLQMTGNATLAAANPENLLVAVANAYTTANGPITDFISNTDFRDQYRALAYGYDWLYSRMDGTQRATVVKTLHVYCRFMHSCFGVWMLPHGTFGLNDAVGDINGNYTGPYEVPYYSCAKISTSHSWYNFSLAILGALSAYGESAGCRELFDLGMNYMLGVTYPYGREGWPNQGRSYGLGGIFDTSTMEDHIAAHTIFPEAALQTNPFWQGFLEFADRLFIPGRFQVHDSLGDENAPNVSNSEALAFGSYGRDLARWTGSGRMQAHFVNQNALPPWSGAAYTDTYWEIARGYLFATPGAEEGYSLTHLNMAEGWLVSTTEKTNITAGFTSGLGMIFQARPRGSEKGHSYPSDLSPELWAYGANLTIAGVDGLNNYGRNPMSQNSLFVNGVGLDYDPLVPSAEYYSRIFAYQAGENYVYACGDSTAAMPAGTTKARRHIIFVKNKFWVIFDEMAAGSAKTFSWLWRVQEDTLTLSGKNLTYTVSAQPSGHVTCYVYHIGDHANLGITHYTGANVNKNPETAVDYLSDDTGTHIAHAVWVKNASTATSFNFLTAMVPIANGGSVPTIARVDDLTVSVTLGAETTVVSFDPSNSTADFVIDPAFGITNALSDNLILRQTINAAPVTEIYRRGLGASATPEDERVNHSGDYPRRPDTGYVYAKHGASQQEVYVRSGTYDLAAMQAWRDALS